MDFESGVDGPTPDEVKEYTIVTQEMVAAGDYDEDELHPAEDELREWGSDLAARKSSKTPKRYYRAIKSLVCWLDYERGIKRPTEASEDAISDYVKWLMASDWSVNTRKGRLNACQQFYSFASEQGWCDDLAGDISSRDYNLDPGAIEESRGGFGEDEHQWIEREKVFLLWDRDNVTSPAVRDSLIFKLMWYTTCRPEAITTMRLEPEDSTGSDPTWWDRNEGWFRVANLKRGGSPDAYRKVFYPADRLNPAIDEWLRARGNLGPYHEESDRLFLTHQKPEMRASHISRKVKQAARNAGIQEVAGYDVHGNERWAVTAKTIRHSAITWLANEAGLPPTVVMEQAGHSKMETTLSYVHDDEQSRKAALNSVW